MRDTFRPKSVLNQQKSVLILKILKFKTLFFLKKKLKHLNNFKILLNKKCKTHLYFLFFKTLFKFKFKILLFKALFC